MQKVEELMVALEQEQKARLAAEKQLEDIIRQKTDEHSQTKSRLADVISNMQEGVLVENENRLIVLTNMQFCKMFNIPLDPEDLIGTDCSGSAEQSCHLFSEPEEFVRRINELLIRKVKVIGEILQLKDGRIFSRDFIPIISKALYRGQYWKYTDITIQQQYEYALKRSEEKYRRLIENMNLGLSEVDLEGRVIYANQSFCELSGYQREDLYGNFAEKVLTSDQDQEIVHVKTASRRMGIADAYEVEITDKNGLKKWWLISGAPLYNNEGIQIGSTGIHLDMTNYKQLEFTLREAKNLAEESARAKETFLANMSHEIRTPMHAILGLGQQLVKTPLSPDQLSLLESINNASDNLLVVINDILDFSKIESGRLDLESIEFSFKNIIDHIEKMLIIKTEEKGIAFNITLDTAIADVLIGDPYRINQILLNLVGNSIKFTQEGSVSLNCVVEETKDTLQTLRIEVRDTGIGIDSDYLETIFDKFTQGSVNLTSKFGGTGLGMAITKQLVDLMDGKISIESKKDHGTSITILISLAVSNQSQKDVIPKLSVSTEQLKGKKILLVEDNKVNRLIANTILSHYEILTTEAANGEIAVELLRNESFDLVLMDMQMPVMDGLTATRLIRTEINTKMPIIALTAHALQAEEIKCREAGMNDFISKPFKEEHLMKTILKNLAEYQENAV
ncbi:MAG: response regulator [Bacteroidota bacterium]